jgi:hypothetical protein
MTPDKEQEQQEQAARRKKVLLITAASVVGTLLLGGLIMMAITSSQFKTYSEETYFIKIKYPNNWTAAPGYEGTVVTFLSPQEDALDTYQENFNIAVKDLSKTPMTLDEYTQTAIKQLAWLFKANLEVVESKPVTISGQRGYKYVSQSPNPTGIIMTIFWFIKNDQAYTITYVASRPQYEKYRAKFDEMVRSFSIPTL